MFQVDLGGGSIRFGGLNCNLMPEAFVRGPGALRRHAGAVFLFGLRRRTGPFVQSRSHDPSSGIYEAVQVHLASGSYKRTILVQKGF